MGVLLLNGRHELIWVLLCSCCLCCPSKAAPAQVMACHQACMLRHTTRLLDQPPPGRYCWSQALLSVILSIIPVDFSIVIMCVFRKPWRSEDKATTVPFQELYYCNSRLYLFCNTLQAGRCCCLLPVWDVFHLFRPHARFYASMVKADCSSVFATVASSAL